MTHKFLEGAATAIVKTIKRALVPLDARISALETHTGLCAKDGTGLSPDRVQALAERRIVDRAGNGR